MKNQSVGRKMSRNFYFYKVKSRHICEIFKTCFVNANDDFDDKPTYLYQVLSTALYMKKYFLDKFTPIWTQSPQYNVYAACTRSRSKRLFCFYFRAD